MNRALSATRRNFFWLGSLLLLLSAKGAFAHGNSAEPEMGWHKLEFWNGEFHLFGMIFWLAIAVLIFAIVNKFAKAKPPQDSTDMDG
ncbi:MAG: hypothetical protein V7752_08400 [Halopseudomonas sp.]